MWRFFQANPKGLQALTLYPKAGFLRPKKGIGTPDRRQQVEDLETEKILPKLSGKEKGTAPCVKLSLKKEVVEKRLIGLAENVL